MQKVFFPDSELTNLCELSEFIKKAIGDIQIELTEGEIYGKLDLCDLKCDSLKIYSQSKTVFTGAKKILCNFRRYNESIIVADIGKNLSFERAESQGINLIPARYPDYDENKLLNGVSSYKILEKRLVDYGVKSGYIRSLHCHEWGGNSYFIEGIDGGRLKLKWLGDNNRGNEFKKDCVIAEYIFEELDSENEWYYDSDKGLFYLYDNTGFEGDKLINIMTDCCLLSITNSKNICIEGITFHNTDRSMFKAEWDRYLRSDWAYNKISTIDINNSIGIDFKNCVFTELGSNCIGIFNNSSDINVINCDFSNCLTNGILILGAPDSTYCNSDWNNHITYMEDADKFGAKSDNYPKNINIENCYFYNLGIIDKQSAAVCISLAYRVLIKNCTIHHLPRAGINISENAFGGHIIEGCDIFDCVRETGDHGPFNSWGRDRFWSLKKFDTTGKYGKLKKSYALSDMLDCNIIRNSRFVGKSGFGIDLDDGSSNYVIENNVCVNVGIKLREGFNRTVRNNTIINAPIDLHATFYKNDDVIENNNVYNKKPLAVIILNKGYNTVIRNNNFYNASDIYKKIKILKNQRNNWIYVSDINLNKFDTNENYGVIGKEKPVLYTAITDTEQIKYEIMRGILSQVNDTVRSLTGAENYEGLYVEKIKLLSPLKKYGLKEGDIIKKINGISVNFNNIDNSLKNINKIEIFREHTIIEL